MKPTLFTKKRISSARQGYGGADVERYDSDNAYPQRVIDIVNNSSTAGACVNLFSKFIQGQGFKDQLFYKMVVNRRGLTNDKALRKVALNMFLGSYAIHFNYNLLGEKTEMTPIPSWFLRFPHKNNKKHFGEILLHEDWDGSKDKFSANDIQYFNPYNPDPETILKEIEKAGGINNYKGQILWFDYEERNYSLAKCDSVLEDMQTEGHAKIFKYRNITTNFMASYFLITDGNEKQNEATTPEEAILRREELRGAESFDANLEQFQGADDALKICHLTKTHPEQTFELKKVDIQDVEDLYEFTETSCRDNIIRCFGQPPILLSVAIAGKLGTSSEIKDATDFYNAITQPDRIAMEELFTEIFKGWYEPIDFDMQIIPIQSRVLISTDILNILKEPSIAPEQKKNILIMLHDFTEEEANKLVPQIIP